MAFGTVSNYQNKFYIQGQEILGIDTIDLNYSNTPSVNKFLGTSKGLTSISSITQQKLSLSRHLIYQDDILSYTGSMPIAGSINYNSNSYGFQSGYLDEYMINCSVGSIPKISTNITIYDEMVSGKNSYGTTVTKPIYVPKQGDISVTCDGSTTNRVLGFDFSLRSVRKPLYSVGSKTAVEIVSFPTIEYAMSVQIDIDDYFLKSGHSFLSYRQNKNISFSIKSRDKSTILQSFTIPNASLVGESLSSSAEAGIKLTLNYIGHS